ncbi:MAG: hypothetical protein K0S61_3192 [Anaerocolumna sp.]|nr:hypothetical protein [Anaerocolumna sp.]
MIETFVTSFKLRNTYKTNSILYVLKTIPLVKKLIPDSLYGSFGIKSAANFISILIEIGSVFIGKVLYLLLMVSLPLEFMKSTRADAFVHIFFFLTIIGGLMNTHIFNPTKDKYYAMFIMRMNAREYTLSNYLYFLIKTWIGFLPLTLWLGIAGGLEVITCLLMPFLVCGIKVIATAVILVNCEDSEIVMNENLPSAVVWIGVAICLVAAYLLPFLGIITMNETIFLILSLGVIVAGGFYIIYLLKYEDYQKTYKTLLTSNKFAINTVSSKQVVKESYRKKISIDISQTSKKSGYKYFNEIFMKRHSKMLTKSAKKLTLILLITLTGVTIACYYVPEIKALTNKLMLTFFPYFLFVMYIINRGGTITSAMFMNCDHSMLSYRFYRQPKSILVLFMERLKYIVLINLMPAIVIAIGLPFLLYISGGTDNLGNYVILFVSILAMSVFFSVHTLVMYYLLQPYNANMESKGAIYTIVNVVTYYICFYAIGKKVSTLTFGMGVSAFCIIYVLIALLLAYRLAPKTFKLRT